MATLNLNSFLLFSDQPKKLGTKVIQPPYHPDEEEDSKSLVATFADPDNNFFQLVSPMM